jgi:Domain of unknown function (DUF4863)
VSKESLTQALQPLVALFEGLSVKDPKAAVARLNEVAPLSGDLVSGIREAVVAGSAAGWLHPKENAGIRFGRVAKDLAGYSVDAVLMSQPGPRHRHPNGEIDLCFTLSGEAKFDGHPEGWVVYAPDSVHVPTVRDGEMVILYFLPGGAIDFNPQ